MYRLLIAIGFVASVGWLIVVPGPEPLVVCVTTLALVFRDELHAVIGKRIFSLTPRTKPLKNLAHTKYSFGRPEYINPMVIADLYGWISDVGDQIVAINVSDSNASNRYYSEVSVSKVDGHPVVSAKSGHERFSYQYIGRSFTGIHLLRTWSSGSGTLVSCSLMLVTLSTEPSLDVSVDGVAKTDGFIVRKIASIPLGDRYEGRISYRLGLLTIEACAGRKALRTKRQRLLIV